MRKTVIMIRIYMLCMQQCACAAKEEKKRIRRMHSGRQKERKGTHAILRDKSPRLLTMHSGHFP